jgi:hypothetical protein
MDYARASPKALQTILWTEPERVAEGTYIDINWPTYVIGKTVPTLTMEGGGNMSKSKHSPIINPATALHPGSRLQHQAVQGQPLVNNLFNLGDPFARRYMTDFLSSVVQSYNLTVRSVFADSDFRSMVALVPSQLAYIAFCSGIHASYRLAL